MTDLAFVNEANKKDLDLAKNLLKNFPSGCRQDLIIENLHKTSIFDLIMARLHGDGGHSKQIIVDLINKVFEDHPNKILQDLSYGLKEDKKKDNIDTVFIEFIIAFLNKDYQELSKLANSNVTVCENENQPPKEVIFLDYLFNKKEEEELAELKFVVEMFKISSGKGKFKDYYKIPETQRNIIEKIVSLDVLALSAAISAGEYVKIWKFLAKKENYHQNKESLMIYSLITTCNIPKFLKTDNILIFNLVFAGFGGLIFKGLNDKVFPLQVINEIKQILDETHEELMRNFNQRDKEDYLQVEIGLGDRNYDAEGTWFSNEFTELVDNVAYYFPFKELVYSIFPHMAKELTAILKRLLSYLGSENNLSIFFVIGSFFVSFSGIVKFNIFEDFLEGNNDYFLQEQVEKVAKQFGDYGSFIKSFIFLATAGFDKVRKHQTNSLSFTEKYVRNEMQNL